jgi:hypothetical protein
MDLVLVCLFYSLGTTFAIYLAPTMLVFSIFVSIPLLIYQWKNLGMNLLKNLFSWNKILIVIGSMIFLYFLQIQPYVVVYKAKPSQDFGAAMLFSATPFSLLQKSGHSFWYKATNTLPGAWESSYFPGYALLFLGLAFLAYRIMRYSLLRRESEPRSGNLIQMSSSSNDLFVGTMIIFFITCVLMSLGPYLKLNMVTAVSIPMPYYFLSKFLPGLDLIRAPGRFGMMIGFPLSIIGVSFLQEIRITNKWKEKVLATFLFALIIESIPFFQLYPFDPDPQGTYHWVAENISPGSPLLELPLTNKGEYANQIASQQLVGSTIHWAHLASGYAAQESPEYLSLVEIDRKIQTGEMMPAEIVDFAQSNSIEWLLLHKEGYSLLQIEDWNNLLRKCSVKKDSNGNAILVNLSSCP